MPRGQGHGISHHVPRGGKDVLAYGDQDCWGRDCVLPLTADNQMTRKPNLALNAEIVSSGRTANSAARKARDPEIIDPR
jgi:hypothetical protein